MKPILTMLLALAGLTACQQTQSVEYKFPRSAAEDTEKIMSEQYWSYWNEEAQARIDADIEKNRKGDATLTLENIAKGSEVVVEQLTSDFGFGASSFNWNQLGKSEYDDEFVATVVDVLKSLDFKDKTYTATTSTSSILKKPPKRPPP